MKILIVEDEVLSAKFLKLTLEKLGHEVVSIVDEAEACKNVLRDSAVDLVLMDINIKGSTDGLQLAREISKLYALKIVFITSYSDSQTIKEATLSSPIGFLIKPIMKSAIEAIMMVASVQWNNEQVKEIEVEVEKISFGALHYNLEKNLFIRNNEIVSLSKLETKALELFMQNINISVSSEQLMRTLWQEEKSKSSLRELLSRLRKKLPELKLQNNSNIGYILYSN